MVLLRDCIAEVLVTETMSALPIEDKVGMAMAVIPRAGAKFIEAGKDRIPVTEDAHGLASDPLNATYIIEGNELTLQNGRSEVAVAPDSATRIRTFISGDLVEVDLDGNGDQDAVLILVHDPSGSGTFYYVAAALNLNGGYRGTNAVLLGDRIAPRDITIRNRAAVATYAVCRLAAMCSSP